jgi:hypothetical protein
MMRKHLPTMFKFEGEQEFRTLKRNQWPVGETKTCYVGLQQTDGTIIGQVKDTYINVGGYLINLNDVNKKGSVQNLSNGRGYFLITQAKKFTPQLQHNFMLQIEEQQQLLEQQRKDTACNFIQDCTNEQLTQIEQLISTLS